MNMDTLQTLAQGFANLEAFISDRMLTPVAAALWR